MTTAPAPATGAKNTDKPDQTTVVVPGNAWVDRDTARDRGAPVSAADPARAVVGRAQVVAEDPAGVVEAWALDLDRGVAVQLIVMGQAAPAMAVTTAPAVVQVPDQAPWDPATARAIQAEVAVEWAEAQDRGAVVQVTAMVRVDPATAVTTAPVADQVLDRDLWDPATAPATQVMAGTDPRVTLF